MILKAILEAITLKIDDKLVQNELLLISGVEHLLHHSRLGWAHGRLLILFLGSLGPTDYISHLVTQEALRQTPVV